MTNEEVIHELRDAIDSEVRYGDIKNHYGEVMRRVEALDMAIKAVEFVQKLEEARKHSFTLRHFEFELPHSYNNKSESEDEE